MGLERDETIELCYSQKKKQDEEDICYAEVGILTPREVAACLEVELANCFNEVEAEERRIEEEGAQEVAQQNLIYEAELETDPEEE